MKYKDWLNEWLANYVKSSVKIRTYNRYLLIVNLHIAKKLGEYEIDELTPLLLQQFITTLMQSGNNKTGKGLSPNTVNAIKCRLMIIKSKNRVVIDTQKYLQNNHNSV